jgi:N-acetylmuramoyl-L-alanine amidase
MRILKTGSFGQDVRDVQTALNKNGYSLEVDGWFGDSTRNAVIDFQTKQGLATDGIVGYNTLSKLGLVRKAEVEWLVIHVSATPERVAGWNAKAIVNYHVNTLGWGRPGYARIIEENGQVVETWQVDDSDGIQPFEMTYGVGTPAVDLNALNVCMIGGLDKNGVPKDTRTKEQTASLTKLVKEMIAKHPNIKIAGHNQFWNKACPCFFIPTWLKSIGIDAKNIYENDPFGYSQIYPNPSPKA